MLKFNKVNQTDPYTPQTNRVVTSTPMHWPARKDGCRPCLTVTVRLFFSWSSGVRRIGPSGRTDVHNQALRFLLCNLCVIKCLVKIQECLQGGVQTMLRLPRVLPPLPQGAWHRASVPRSARPMPARRGAGGPQHKQQQRLPGLLVVVVRRLQWPPRGRRGRQVQAGGVVDDDDDGETSTVPTPEEG
jgi:hypothetical protein